MNLKFQIQLLDSVSDLIIILFFVLMLCWCCQIWINLHFSLKPVIVARSHCWSCFGLPHREWHMGTREWHMGTLEAVELGHAREVTRLGHPDILPWNYKSKHQFGTFLITTKKLKMYFFSYPVPKWPKCNYLTIIQLCFVLFWFICSQNPKIYGPTWLGAVQNCTSLSDLKLHSLERRDWIS